MHFKLDENVPLKLINLIEKQGHEAGSVFSQKISGITDAELLSTCKKEKCTLITLDNDFTNIKAYPPESHEGIIVIRIKGQGAKSVTQAFENFINKFDIKRSKKNLIIIEKEHIRIRSTD